jgi:Zn-dependent protease with chaperone function
MAGPLPSDRTTFFEFQARNRRATWRLGAAYALVIGGGGILAAAGLVVNLFLALFALVFIPSVALIGLGFLALLTPATAGLSAPLLAGGTFVLGLVGDLPLLLPGGDGGGLRVLALALPLGSWLAVRSAWRAAGVGDVLLAMGARAPAPDDLEERQLVNIVHELAIAAGIAPPEVRLLDAKVTNAAAVGRDGGPSHVVVARRVLDEFDREETQALLAHVIGSVGNGDLRGAAQIHSLLYVLELLIVVVLAPFAREPRRLAARWLAFPLRAPGLAPDVRAERARALIRDLGRHRARFGREGGDDHVRRLGREYFGPVGAVLVRACPPLMALLFFAQAATLFLLLFASLPVGLLWRSRRYLADATAVELTRSPTGLYRALRRLGETGGMVPGAEAVSHLFVVGPEAAGWRAAHGRAPLGEPSAGGRARPGDGATFWEREGLLMGMHPALDRRLRRLVRMGALVGGHPQG